MRKAKRILGAMLALVMLLSLLPQQAFAEDDWAYVRFADGTVKWYGSLPAAWDAAVARNRSTVGLNNRNWEGGRFVVPAGKTVTVELNGNYITRSLSSSKSDGEVFYVGERSTLIVYGGSREDPAYRSDAEHNMWVYVANADRYGYTRRQETLHGGVINGGNSSNGGGGIHMKESAQVYLYNVTVAGNKADNDGASYGDGGGVEMNNTCGYLYLEDSRIIYNAARYDGGGVHVDSSYCRIEMVRSHIDHNVADDNGGGIYVDGDSFSLRGDAEQFMDPLSVVSDYSIPDWTGSYAFFPPDELGSSVSYNCVFDSEDGGGAIYMDNETGLIQGVNIIGNIATNDDDKGSGGGIYLDEEQITVRRCNILRNKADLLGGGIHVRGDDNIADRDDNAVDSCTLWWNLAMDSGGAGGGIYVYRYCDLNISGSLIVRENVSKTYGNDNLFLSSDGATINAYLIPSLTHGADVYVRRNTAGASGHSMRISRDAGTYDASQFSYDNDSRHHIAWDRSWDDRVLRVIDGAKPEKAWQEPFIPDRGRRTRTVAGGYTAGNTTYALIKGIVSYPSSADDSADIENVFYYSDGFFAGDAKTYNPQLATASLCLACASGYSNEYGKDEQAGSYLDKSRNFRQFVSDIGCRDEDIFINDFNMRKPDAYTIGVGIASKPVLDGKTLVIIGVRGIGYEAEWTSNMALGSTGEAEGWSSAATQVMAELAGYLRRKGIDGSSEDTIFWIAGYSRAGATANLTAKRIVDTYDNRGTHTFAYPMEAPMGGVKSALDPQCNYNCIHNVINQNDIVPWVGTTEMGFIRYGVDHYVPGSPGVSADPTDGGDNNVVPEDNAAWKVEQWNKTGNYDTQRKQMLKQLSAVNPEIVFDDYFHRATIRYITGMLLGSTDMIVETDDHETEMPDTERFIDYFFDRLQAWGFMYDIWGHNVSDDYTPREYFSTFEVKNNRTFQQGLATAVGLVFGKTAEESDGLIDCLNGLANRLNNTSSLYFNIDEDDIDDLYGEIKSIWQQLTDPTEEDIARGYCSIGDYLTEQELWELEASFVSLVFPLLTFAGEDYENMDQDVAGTMAHNIPRIIANHYQEVTHAWLRSYDALYTNDTAPVVMDPDVKRAPSGVKKVIIHEDGSRQNYSAGGGTFDVKPGDTLQLIPDDERDMDAGEAIYYEFLSGKAHVQGPHAYTEPLRLKDLIADNVTDGAIVLRVTAAHNGQKLDPVTITMRLHHDAYLSVPRNTIRDAYEYSTILQHPGDRATIRAIVPNERDRFRFKRWEAYPYLMVPDTAGDTPISPDMYVEYFGTDFNAFDETTTVANLAGVSARFIPVYDKFIRRIAVALSGSASDGLPARAACSEDGGGSLGENCPISWSYDTASGRYVAQFSITIPDNEILAGPEDLAAVWENLDSSGYKIKAPVIESIAVSGRNAQLTAAFDPAEAEDEDGRYMPAESRVTVNAFDLNLNTTVGTYYFYPDSDAENAVTVSAPVLPDMEFTRWRDVSDDAGNPTRSAGTGETLTACYRPVVNQIEAIFSGPIVVGKKMPKLDGLTVRISNTWRIDNAALTWNRSHNTALNNTVYTARITADKTRLMGTNLNDPSGGSVSLTGAFSFSELVGVNVVDAGGNALAVTNYMFHETEQTVYMDIVFEKTGKQKILASAPVNVSVSNGSDEDAILAALPDTVYAYLEDGRMIRVPIRWDSAGSVDADAPALQTVLAFGNPLSSVLEQYELDDGLSLSANVTVLARPRAPVPAAMPRSGSFDGAREIRLSADDGAVIYYAAAVTDNDAPVPNPNALSYQEYTGPVALTELGRTTYLFAYTVKDGLADSGIVLYVYRLTESSGPTPASPFVDVGAGAYYHDAVQWAVNRSPQITNGTDATHFSPDSTCTRAQALTFLWRAMGEPEPANTDNPFTDVKAGQYYYKAVLWALEKGVTTGTSAGKFSPDAGCTRGQAVTFLHRAQGTPAPGGSANPFTDVPADQYYCDAVLWAVNHDPQITNGTSAATFSPGSTCTRGQIVTFLYRSMK